MNKPKNNIKKNIVKPRVSRKLVMSTAASLMALVIVASLVWNAIKVSVPAEAQNTLSGVSEALKDHGSGESYVILNIVPGTTSEEIPLGTIGDLTSGQSSREKKLAEVLKGYRSYEDIIAADGTTVETKGRLSVAEDYATNAGVGYAYEESTTGGSGWTRIYEGSPCVAGEFSLDDPDTEKAAYKSIIYGTISKLDGGAYRLADDFKTPPVTRIANANAIFKSSGAAKEGFPLSDAIRISGDLEGYDDDIPLYVLSDDGVTYVYADKRIKDIRAEEEEEEEPEETVTGNDIIDTETDITDDGTGDVTDTGTEDGTDTGTEDGTDTGTEDGTDTGTEDGTGTGTGDGTGTGTGDGTGTGTGDGTGTGTGDGTGTGTEGGTGTGTGDGTGTGTGDGTGTGTGDGTGTGTGGGTGTGTGDGTDAGTNGATNTVGDVSVESDVSDVTAVTTGVSVTGWIKFIGTDASVSGNTVSNPDTNANQGTATTATPNTNGPAEQNPVTPAAPESGKEPVKSPSLDAETAQSPAADLDSDDSEEETEYYILEFGEYIKSDEIIEGVDLYTTDDYHEEPIANDAMEISLFSARAASDAITIEDELVYVGEGNGNYTITQTQNKDGVKAYKVYNAPTYFRCYATDYIKEYVLCDNGINIKVNVKSASEVNAEDVRNADLIYIEDANSNAISYITSNNDMSESVVYSILDRAANDLMPVIVDYSVAAGGAYNSAYSGTNYQKLAEILLKTDLYSFFYDMGDVTTMLMNAGSDDYGSKGDADNHYVNNNIYVVNTGDGITLSRGEDFTNPFGETEISGFEEVKSAIDAENKWNDDDDKLPPPSKAMAIQYIINYADGFIGEFRDFAILELQPAAGDTDLNTRNDSRNNTILYWRRPGTAGSGQQILRSRKSIVISVDTESVAQFSGEQSDINDKYQMVFIGLDGQKLNYKDNDTVYNDTSMNGIVYSDTGDIADGSGQRYDGIDITVQKKEALLAFLSAGYPVVVEDGFFIDKTAKDVDAGAINTKYIDESSQIYDFLRIALSEESCRWCLYTISDTRRNSSDFAAQINVHRPQVAYDWDNSVNALCNNEVQQEQVVQTISAGIDGSYRGYIPYKVTNDVGESYQNGVNARFYMDMNQDGRFDASEKMTGEGVAVDSGLVTVEFSTPERGIIPWKLEISDTGNEYSRASLNGYFKIAQSTQMPIRVVQIIGGTVEGSIDAKFNFELAYDMSDLALLGYYFKDAELLTNTKFDIKTMTVGQLAEELKFNEEYLSGADVLLLGFGPDCSLSVPVEGRDKNVEWYINKYISEGRGVLLSSAASSETAGRLQIAAPLLGQKDIKTYNRLGSDKPSSVDYYKYNNLEDSMFAEWNMLSAAKINDGAVSHYPYNVAGDITVHDNVRIPDYVLDLSSNGASGSASDVTAWYSLGDVELFDEKTSYGVSPKDAANNYYIYSKGNVVYIGDSRYPYVYDSTVSTVPADGVQGTNNCKLFINALMEAYGVGIKNPKVSIVAGLSDDSADTDSICIPYDEQIKDLEAGEGALVSNGVLDDTVDVYFKISEPNFAFRKDVTLAFYYEDAAGMPVDVGGKIVNATPFASEVWTVDQNRLVPVNVTSGLDLIPGKIYKIKAPVISLRADDNSVNADIYIVVQSHFIKLGQERHPIGSDSVTLNRAQLFLLE